MSWVHEPAVRPVTKRRADPLELRAALYKIEFSVVDVIPAPVKRRDGSRGSSPAIASLEEVARAQNAEDVFRLRKSVSSYMGPKVGRIGKGWGKTG